MAWYRVYFLSRTGDIRNVDEFEAETDPIAVTFADQIHEAVSDIYEGYEVWHLSRCVARRTSREKPRPALCHAQITERIQASLLRREEVLHASETAFSRSRLLLEKMRGLREVVKTRQYAHRSHHEGRRPNPGGASPR
ncbi:MAG TPA: hypothetical protein VN728_15370 [Stellaceae bacterium]|jgi:hypothetical protein|nr:hypothetical protein [Stellaceae bacterium]